MHVLTSQGYVLVVDGEFDGDAFKSLSLTGPVKKVFDGEIDWTSLDAVTE